MNLRKLDRTSWRYALRLALTCMLIVAIYQHFHLHNGYWAAFSVLGCIFPTAGQSFRRIKQRIIGTFLGMILGILVAHAAGTHWLYIDLFIPIFVFLTVYLKVFNYTFYALFNTIIAVMLVCLIAPGDWQIAYVRMEMTLLGCLIALAATYWLLPNRATEALPEQMQQLRLSLKAYYLSLIRPFVENDNAHSQLHRQRISQILEKTDAQLQEARYEAWSWKHPLRKTQNPQEKTYNDLHQCYQTLLLLELVVHPLNIQQI